MVFINRTREASRVMTNNDKPLKNCHLVSGDDQRFKDIVAQSQASILALFEQMLKIYFDEVVEKSSVEKGLCYESLLLPFERLLLKEGYVVSYRSFCPFCCWGRL